MSDADPAPRISRRRVLRLGAAAGGAAAVGAVADIALQREQHTSRPVPAASATPRAAAAAVPIATSAPIAATVDAFPSDPRVRVQHLLRRAGFAPSHAEVDHALQLTTDNLIDELLNPDRIPESPAAQLAAFAPADPQKPRPRELVDWWLGRMAATSRPSLEKITFFWHGFHTSGFDKLGAKGTQLLADQNTFQRATAFGDFGDILKGLSRQPAMMIYLDIIENVKAHANENFGRELMELFSLGVGNYTEVDVRQVARAFTGYSLDRQHQFVMRAAQHDNTVKTILGHSGNFSGDDAIDIIVSQPAASKFVAKKVWTAFAYPNPDAATLAPIAQRFVDTGGDMREVFRAVFTHPDFTAPHAYRALVKSPVEYAIGAVRQLQVDVDPRLITAQVSTMGQVPFNPPNVAGWPGGDTWMGSGAFLGGINGADAALFRVRGNRAGLGTGFDVAQYLDDRQIATAGQLVDDLLVLLVDGGVSTAQRATLVDYASGGQGDATRLSGMTAAQRDQRVRGTAYLVMAGPEYHLA